MMTALTRDSLAGDVNTVIASPRRNSVQLHGVNLRRLIARAGIDRSMYWPPERCWLIPLLDLLAFIRQAEKDRRIILVEDDGHALGGAA